MQKLLKNKEIKERVIEWLRLAVGMNQEKQKMYTQFPVASDGFVLNLIEVLLLFCKPFTHKFSEYHTHISKINCFYLLNDQYIYKGSSIEKLDQECLNVLKTSIDVSSLPFTGVT